MVTTEPTKPVQVPLNPEPPKGPEAERAAPAQLPLFESPTAADGIGSTSEPTGEPSAEAPKPSTGKKPTEPADFVDDEPAGVVPEGLSSSGTRAAAVMSPPVRARRGPLLDPGWLFLIAGVALIAFTVIIPAVNDLHDAEYYRERMRSVEQHRLDRLTRYQGYHEALRDGEPGLVRSLAATQLNQAPENAKLLQNPDPNAPPRSASIFGALEPPPLVMPNKPVREVSTLEKWATDDRSRLWLLASGALLILIGLLPPSRGRV